MARKTRRRLLRGARGSALGRRLAWAAGHGTRVCFPRSTFIPIGCLKPLSMPWGFSCIDSFVMERDFSIVFRQNDSRRSFIRQGFLFCEVTKLFQPRQRRCFVYCLHCTKLKSLSWFYRHKKKVGFVPSDDDVVLYETRLFHFQQDIITELDMLNSIGKLFVRRHVERSPLSSNTQLVFKTVSDCSMTRDQSHDHPGVVGDDYNYDEEDNPEEDDEEGSSIQVIRTVESISDCFFDCFQSSQFSLDHFVDLFSTFYETDGFSTQTPHTIDNIKSKNYHAASNENFCFRRIVKESNRHNEQIHQGDAGFYITEKQGDCKEDTRGISFL